MPDTPENPTPEEVMAQKQAELEKMQTDLKMTTRFIKITIMPKLLRRKQILYPGMVTGSRSIRQMLRLPRVRR